MTPRTLGACERLGLDSETHRDGARHSIEFGSRARIDHLPGVPAGSSFLGTFDREEAVEDESIDFFAAGHPLVEGVLAHLEDSGLGRVGLLEVAAREVGEEGFGVLALYRTAAGFESVALDANGRERPDWAERLVRLPLRSRRVRAAEWTSQPGWPELIRALARKLASRGRPAEVAAFRLRA